MILLPSPKKKTNTIQNQSKLESLKDTGHGTKGRRRRKEIQQVRTNCIFLLPRKYLLVYIVSLKVSPAD
jgi:hypothetical protein